MVYGPEDLSAVEVALLGVLSVGLPPSKSAGDDTFRVDHVTAVVVGRFLLLPYPCAQLYQDGAITNGTLHRTCASKATPDNAHAAPFQYLFMSGTSFSSPAVAGIVALMLDKNGSLDNSDAAFGTLSNPASWGPGSLEVLLEGSATPIPGDAPSIRQRTGVFATECWEKPACPLEATGFGWVFVDDALAAVP